MRKAKRRPYNLRKFARERQDVGITMVRKAGIPKVNLLVTVRSKNV